MESLEALLYTAYDCNGSLCVRFIHNDLLEAPCKRLVLLDILHILVRCGRAEHL